MAQPVLGRGLLQTDLSLDAAVQPGWGSFSLTPTREFPCKLYHTTGICINGDDCMFSHEPLTDETQELLDKVK